MTTPRKPRPAAGRPAPKPNRTSKSELVNVRLPADLLRQLRAIRDAQGTPVTKSISLAVQHWLTIREAKADALFVVEFKGGTVKVEQKRRG